MMNNALLSVLLVGRNRDEKPVIVRAKATKGDIAFSRNLIPALFALCLFGCAASHDLPPGYTLDAKSQEGLIIVSLSLSGKELDKVSSFEYRIREVPALDENLDEKPAVEKPYFDSVKQHARGVQSWQRDRDTVWNVLIKEPNFNEPLDVIDAGRAQGRLAAVSLPAGGYEFYTWSVREPNPFGGIEHSPQEAFNYRFTVKPGRATYIGQLNLHLSERGGHKITVEDKRARDMALLMKKAPSLGTVQVTSEVGQVQP